MVTPYPLKYNLYLINFQEIEIEILNSFQKELLSLNIQTYDSLPKQDYLKLVHYFTLVNIFKSYTELEHKKNTIFWIDKQTCNPDILNFVEEIKRSFPILLYVTDKPFKMALANKNTAEYTEVTTELKEFRYSIDFSKYSFNKVKRFCTKFGMESLLTSFKL